jgi:SWI/SNF-related matrix-associated actin-dependent regulator of chromatin subfamily A3
VTTLIVSPLTVIGNWYQQIFNHVNGRVENKNITIAKYHGPTRENMLVRVQQGQLDVLMTSYHTLASDYKAWVEAMEGDAEEDLGARAKKKRRKAPHIFELEFHRVVLDEAHIVRNSQASLWKAVMSLQAERKVCLTGTPFVYVLLEGATNSIAAPVSHPVGRLVGRLFSFYRNNPSDIHSLLNFLNVQPLCLPHVFRRMVSDPIKDRREIGLQTVRATMAHVALRRKKDGLMDEIQLVAKTVQTFRIGFIENSEHVQIYEFLYEMAREYFLGLLNSDDKKKASRSLMKMLALVLRIRQCCIHLGIINRDFLEQARAHLKSGGGAGGPAVPQIGAEEGSRLLAFLCDAFKTSTVVECAVCMDEMEEENAVILRSCQHIFCERCLNQIENSICPMCRADYSPADMVTKQVAKGAAEKFSAKDCLKQHGRSPKIQALLNLIEQMAPDEKGVIFSQWTSVLRIIEAEFLKCGHAYDVISGDKTADERIDSMMRFDTERCDTAETPRFMLCSLMACGTGINLTRGNVVFMMDTWWNQAAENQAMDRVHRIGCVFFLFLSRARLCFPERRMRLTARSSSHSPTNSLSFVCFAAKPGRSACTGW